MLGRGTRIAHAPYVFQVQPSFAGTRNSDYSHYIYIYHNTHRFPTLSVSQAYSSNINIVLEQDYEWHALCFPFHNQGDSWFI